METLIKIQCDLKAPKTQNNAFGKYKYRKAEDIMVALKPHLKEANAMLYLSDELILIGDRYYIKSSATYIHGTFSLTVFGFAREEAEKKGMDGSQVTGASSSYARKYALNAMFLIDDNKDSDETNEGKTDESDKIKDALLRFTDIESLGNYYNSLTIKEQEYYKDLTIKMKEKLTQKN